MSYNSTIISKKKNLSCGHYDYNFSKGRCKNCATIQDSLKRIADVEMSDVSFSDLVNELDTLVSNYVRNSAKDENGLVQCYTCPTKLSVAEMQAGHYISRNSMLLRFDYARNIRPQCPYCNCGKHGNLSIFGQRLEQEHKGITEILYEESQVVYKYSKEELKSLIVEMKQKTKPLNLMDV